jgi:hypothetical protein
MKLMDRFYSLLALLLVGSASLQAQSDPFPDNNTVEYKYQGSMTCTSQIVMNGAILTDAVVAVYCEDDLRGKNRIGEDPDNPNLVFLYIHGDYTANKQYLHFKVFTQGKVFTCNPDPAIIFTFNGNVGLPSEPYIIDITPVSLANDADNTATLTTYKDETCDIALTRRTLYKDGDWNTLVLPFAVSTTSGPLSGDNVTAMVLDEENSGLSGTTLTLNFNAAPEPIPAGTPFIIKWDNTGVNITDPVFTGVTVSDATNDVAFTGGSFKGTYVPMSWNTEERSILFLGEKNQLHWPDADASLGACRAYFQLTEGAGVREFKLSFDGEGTQTGVGHTEITDITERADAWYTVNGVKLSGKPRVRGIYVKNGKKVVVK